MRKNNVFKYLLLKGAWTRFSVEMLRSSDIKTYIVSGKRLVNKVNLICCFRVNMIENI